MRRKFFDTLISQVDKEYLENLISYQAHIRQRNSLLRMFAERGSVDKDLIDSYDEKIVGAGITLFKKRSHFIQEYLPLLSDRYNFLTEGLSERASIQYESDLMESTLKRNLNQGWIKTLHQGELLSGFIVMIFYLHLTIRS